MTDNLAHFCFFKTLSIVLEKRMSLGHVSFTPETWNIIANNAAQEIELKGSHHFIDKQPIIIINRTVKNKDTISIQDYKIEYNPKSILHTLAEIVK